MLVAAVVLATLVLAAAGADLLRPATSVALEQVLEPPSLAHPFGTDETGRDVLALSLQAMRISFLISLLAAAVALLIGVTVGVLAGTLSGWVDSALMRLVDLLGSLNHLLFGILLVVLFRPALGAAAAVCLAVGLSHWLGTARIMRGELLSLRERPFVAAAIGGGATRRRLAVRHFLPHLVPVVTVAMVLLLPHAIFHESALSFLGLGLPPHQASLGNLIAAGQRSLLAGAWWISAFPGLLILAACVAFGTLGEYWRDRHQPRWRGELEL
ncbi:MAG: ABC transporter permease [Pseudonocardiaceae bacterium]